MIPPAPSFPHQKVLAALPMQDFSQAPVVTVNVEQQVKAS